MSLGNCAVFLWVSSEAFPLLAASFITEVINSPEQVGCSFQNYDHGISERGMWHGPSLFHPTSSYFILLYTSLCLAVQVEERMDGCIHQVRLWIFFERRLSCFFKFFQLRQDLCNFLNIFVLCKDFWLFWFLALGEMGEKYQWTFLCLSSYQAIHFKAMTDKKNLFGTLSKVLLILVGIGWGQQGSSKLCSWWFSECDCVTLRV